MPLPIPWSEIRAWADLTAIRLQSWEVEVLVAIDRAWIATMG